MVYLYRAVDKAGKTVEFYLSRNRDVNAGRAFLRKAIKNQRMPTKITLDAYAASHRAVADLKASGELSRRVQVRSNKYLNNLIEQDHRRVKQRLRPMLGLKSFRTAAIVISGVELAEKIKKRQYKFGKLGGATARIYRRFGKQRWPRNLNKRLIEREICRDWNSVEFAPEPAFEAAVKMARLSSRSTFSQFSRCNAPTQEAARITTKAATALLTQILARQSRSEIRVFRG